MLVFEDELLHRAQADSAEDAAERLAEDYLRDLNCNDGPTDLGRLLSRFRVRRVIRRTDLPFDAALVPLDPVGYDIYLNSTTSRSRQRFSLAHELGHAILHDFIPETRCFATRSVFAPPGGVVEERVCDRIAAAILMPRRLFAGHFNNEQLTATKLREVAQQFDVSLTAVIRRYRELVDEADVAVARVTSSGSKTLDVDKVIVNFRERRISRHAKAKMRVRAFENGHVGATGSVWLQEPPRLARRCLFVSTTRQYPWRGSALAVLSRRSFHVSQECGNSSNDEVLPMASKFEMYKDKAETGEFRFRLKAGNGEVIAVSEGYKSKESCQNGIESVKKNAPDAAVDD